MLKLCLRTGQIPWLWVFLKHSCSTGCSLQLHSGSSLWPHLPPWWNIQTQKGSLPWLRWDSWKKTNKRLSGTWSQNRDYSKCCSFLPGSTCSLLSDGRTVSYTKCYPLDASSSTGTTSRYSFLIHKGQALASGQACLSRSSARCILSEITIPGSGAERGP